MLIAAAILLTAGAIVFTLAVRAKDLPEPPPPSPFDRLDEIKTRIYDNLRDLQFEYRLGKLSDEDYQRTKTDLQRELAGVLAEIDRIQQELGVKAQPKAAAAKPVPAPAASPSTTCPHCGAKFAKPMKFCGECGKAMGA